MVRNLLPFIVIAILLKRCNKSQSRDPGPEPEPEPEPESEPEPEPEPEPKIDNRVKISGIEGLKLGRRLGFVNKIHITNSSKFYRFKIRYKSHPVLSGITIKWCSADFNTDYEWGEIILYPSDTYTIREDTWRCDIEVIRMGETETRIFKGLSNSSSNIRIIDREMVMPKSMRRGCLPW